jgi:RNA polymerase sigma-54 factor
MKQTLQLKIGQQLTMTPQLQQAIKLLQLSTLDLQQEIQQALDSNPMLELEEDSGLSPDPIQQDDKLTNGEADSAEGLNGDSELGFSEGDISFGESTDDLHDFDGNTHDSDWQDNIPEELPVDSQWDDVFQSLPATNNHNGEDDYDFEAKNSVTESLQDHLLWQLNLCRLSETDHAIALTIIDAIDEKGRLSASINDIHESILRHQPDVEADEIIAVLHRIQQFDPAGVGAQNLQECLMIQLRQLGPETPWLKEAKTIVERHINLLGDRDYPQLMRRMRLTENELKEVMRLVQTLHPHPGEIISSEPAEYIVPDIIVRKLKDRWTVELNPEIAPKIRINSDYASMARQVTNSSDSTFLRNNLQEARWFLKSLRSRNETLLKVASKIVEYQINFFEQGDEAMKPLILHDIAEAVGMHESTISRVTTQKYMHTPRGIYELKYFFSSHVSTESGGECSSTAIRALIKKLVASESPKKPLSDSKIAGLMEAQGIMVARRTIAKYRESLNIAPSSERKRLI